MMTLSDHEWTKGTHFLWMCKEIGLDVFDFVQTGPIAFDIYQLWLFGRISTTEFYSFLLLVKVGSVFREFLHILKENQNERY